MFTNLDKLSIFITCKGFQEKQIDILWPVTFNILGATDPSEDHLKVMGFLSEKMHIPTSHNTHTLYTHSPQIFLCVILGIHDPWSWSTAPKLKIPALINSFSNKKAEKYLGSWGQKRSSVLN